MVIVPHTVNGKFYGRWYHLDSGRIIYLAHRKEREIFQAKWAWCIDHRTLEQSRQRGCWAIGVIIKKEGKRQVWLTHVDDFYGEHSFRHRYETLQRGLPLSKFRVRPDTRAKAIERAMRIR
ncbi:hypothetical protein PQQ87_08225 [Paraburkholderia nemoris]|uniref:hypothetical protein n=1 Tax=Paraburkholderia nemoris TaxID=2793076 RepID=UPI0038B6FB88